IYLQQVLSIEKTEKANPLFLVIHWSENGCYDDSASSYRKKNMTNLHRYLTKLTDRQICLMSEHDLEFKKSQEQKEDFEIFPGFRVNISGLEPRQAPRSDYLNNIPLNSLVVDSVSNQTFITREIIPETKFTESGTIPFKSTFLFREYFRSKLETQKCALILDDSLKMSNLVVIVKDGLGLEEILQPYYDELDKLDQRSLSKLALHMLKLEYSEFEKSLHGEYDFIEEDDIQYIQQNYPEIVSKLEEVIKFIDHKPWIDLKCRFHLAKYFCENNAEDVSHEPIPDQRQYFLEIFSDNSTGIYNLVKKCEKTTNSWSTSFFRRSKTSDIVKKIKEEASQISDSQFKILPKHPSTQFSLELDREFNHEEHELEIREVAPSYYTWNTESYRLFRETEALHPAQLRITIYGTRISQEDSMELEKDEFFIPTPLLHSSGRNPGVSFEIDPETYEFVNISQFDKKFLVILWNKVKYGNKMELYFDSLQRLPKMIELQTPIKKLNSGPNSKIAINDSKGLIAIYSPEKALLNVYGVDYDQTNLNLRYRNIILLPYYNDIAPEINHFLFIRNTEDICFVENAGRAKIYSLINDSFRPGIADFPPSATKILSTSDGYCIVAFTAVQEELNDIEMTDAPISDAENERVNNEASCDNTEEISDAITNNTEEIYKTISDKDEEINESISDNAEEINESISDTEKLNETNSEQLYGSGGSDFVNAHIYFVEGFSQNAKKVIVIPFTKSSIETFQFSVIGKRQIHLIILNQQGGLFQSVLVKITHAKTQYRFERQSQNTTLGQVKIENNKSLTILGKDTMFKRDFRVGDYLIIGEEKRQVSEIVYDNVLKIVRPSFENVKFGQWLSFGIEQITTNNGLIDVYAMVFTKYATTTPIGQIDKPLKATFVVDVSRSSKTISTYEAKIRKYVDKMFEKVKKETKKPSGHLKHFKSAYAIFENLTLDDESTEYLFGEWIILLFCLIPIQIAIARDNEFVPLQDGVFSSELDQPNFDGGYGLIGSVSKAISFGWYEAIFEYYADLEVKVISSMGEQSCKSYLLNHCVGSIFDGSAMRCTEGVWMSVVKTKEILYVALDFEGLASIERTPQEETFMQLLNAALSNLVLFKSQFAVSRDISSMFQRFQDGTNYFGDDPDIFQARFCIIIKDVAKTDREDIVAEFQSKFSRIVDREEEDNFITKLYRNKMSIIPWPVFNEASFYTTFKQLKVKLDAQDSEYNNARAFVEKIKVLMTKLKVCDWGNIQSTLITMRALEIKKFLSDAISFGYEQKEEDPFSDYEAPENANTDLDGLEQRVKPLQGRDDGTLIPDDVVLLSEIFDDIDGSVNLMHDTGLVLLQNGKDFVELSNENIHLRGEIPDGQWIEKYDKFLKFIINRRIGRVQQWFNKNTSRFPNDNNEIKITSYALEQEITKLNLFWNICRLRCDSCSLACLKTSRHDDNEKDMSHDCLTDHLCHFRCFFEEAHTTGTLPECVQFAGHEGRHACAQNHACGAPCVYSGKRSCQTRCAKEMGHEKSLGNETHLCEASRHYCGAPCSLKVSGVYECRNKCIIPCEDNHSVHKCENEVCPIECPLDKCQRKCESRDHFHSFEKDAQHFCGNEHQCPKDCEEIGICKIVTEPTAMIKEQAEYVNKFGSFMFTKYSQTFQRLQCCKKIPSYKFEHEGKHVHEIRKLHVCNTSCPNDKGKHIKEENDKQNFHYCDIKCPNCAYYCNLPYDHGRMHNTEHYTVHGNMLMTTFTCEEEEFEFEGHRLNVGDHGDFVLCHKLCENMGRHRHIDFCKDPGVCESEGGSRKEASISPQPSRKKDYISHRVFWERTMFQDPYTKEDRENFKKCDHECADEKHHNVDEKTGQEPVKSYCTQEIFHTPVDPKTFSLGRTGYISTDGHHFTCENPTKNVGDFHIVFVVDRSGSMSIGDCKPICSSTATSRLKLSHDNRLGAVYDAVYTFIDSRRSSRKASPSGQMAVDRDTVSLVLFDHNVDTAFENESLSKHEELLTKMMKFRPGGDNYYNIGIYKASEIFNKYYDASKTNVIIFLSDGEYHAPETELRRLCEREANRGSPIFLYTIMFTGGTFHMTYGKSLQRMADIASEYLPKTNDKDSLKCQYVLAMNQIKLTEHFIAVAESLRKHRPMLMRK
ncbi:10371_t:CDS:10, partial [Funneliformis caledonium]